MEVDKQLRTLEIPGCDTDIVFGALVIEFGQTPVNQTQLEHMSERTLECHQRDRTNLALLVVNHDIVRLHIAMHDTLAVAEVQSLQQLVDVESNVVISEPRIKSAKIGVVHGLENQARSLALIIAHDIEKSDNIRASGEVLEDLDLSLDLLLLDGLKNLDDAFLIIDDVDAFEHL